jgi:hypothetical protein
MGGGGGEAARAAAASAGRRERKRLLQTNSLLLSSFFFLQPPNHPPIQATYLADRVIVYDGEPSKCATAHRPQSLLTGMNSFLKALDITFRRDPTNYRPRINKLGSTKDQEQKSAGSYYYLDED